MFFPFIFFWTKLQIVDITSEVNICFILNSSLWDLVYFVCLIDKNVVLKACLFILMIFNSNIVAFLIFQRKEWEAFKEQMRVRQEEKMLKKFSSNADN